MADTFSDAPVDLPTDGDPIPSLPDKILTHILSLIALVNADRISSLPDKILIHILSFLPTTKTRIQTSVLSKRWRHLWISVPSIDLSFPLLSPAVTIEDDYQYHCIVDRILHHYPHPTLNRLSVDHQSASHYTFITPSDEDLDVRELQLDSLDSTIRFAASKSVQEIQLRFHSFPDTCDNPRIPQSLLLCSETLISLKLTSLCFPKLSIDFQGFPFLKTLHLNFVLFTNSDALAQLFSSYCPSLESLILDKSRWVPNVSITPPIFPNLLSFKFVNFMDRSPQNLCCEAPNLRYFHFSGALECLYLKNCPRLHSAHIHSSGTGLPSCRKMIEIAHTFANVQVLVVGYWFFPHFHHSLPKQKKKLQLCKDYPICHGYNFNLPVFENLKEFHCHGILLHKLTMRALLVFVCKCRSLEKLCINLDFYKSGLPEFILTEERNASSSTKNDILEDYDDQLCNFKGVEEVYHRIVEEKQLLCCRQDLQLRLKTITVMQFADDAIYMRMLRFIFEKSPGLELLQLKVVQQQPRVDLAQLEEQIRCFPGVAPSVKMELSETEVSEYDSYCRGKCSPLEHLWG